MLLDEKWIFNCTDVFYERLKEYTERIVLIGSYTCDNYFVKLLDYMNDNKIVFESYDLVVPILSEKNITILDSCCFEKIARKANQIVVNDYGTLKYLSLLNYSCRLGRLLFHQYRDSRYLEVENRHVKVECSEIINILRNQGCIIDAIEIDLVSVDMDIKNEIDVYVHYPYRLLSVTRICEFCGEIHKDCVKFSPEQKCSFQCKDVYMKISDTSCFKRGKGVYEKLSEKYDSLCKGKNIILMEELS